MMSYLTILVVILVNFCIYSTVGNFTASAETRETTCTSEIVPQVITEDVMERYVVAF